MDFVAKFVYCSFLVVHNANGGSKDMCKARFAISGYLIERQLFDMYHGCEEYLKDEKLKTKFCL